VTRHDHNQIAPDGGPISPPAGQRSASAAGGAPALPAAAAFTVFAVPNAVAQVPADVLNDLLRVVRQIEAQQPDEQPDDSHYANGYARALGRAKGLAAVAMVALEHLSRHARPPRVRIPPQCHCGSQLSLDDRAATLDASAGALSIPAECDDCGSTYLVTAGFEAGEYVRWDAEDVEVDDDGLSERAEQAKRDAQAPDRTEDM